MSSDAEPDLLVLGSGMAGLSLAALAAHDGARVRVLEAHSAPGGYAHSFAVGPWTFCAQVHYVFGCEPGGAIAELLATLGLEVPFHRLDPDGFDHVVVAGERFRIPNGHARHRERLVARFPEQARAIHRWFELLGQVDLELARLPAEPGPLDWLAAPLRVPHLLRHRHSTVGEVFGALEMSPRLRAVLAGQCGDYLLPPASASFLVHAALVNAYDRGAWYPVHHYAQLVDALVGAIRARPDCAVELDTEVTAILVEGGRVRGVRSADGRVHRAGAVVSNIDPARTRDLLPAEVLPARYRARLDYPYSASSFTLYLGLEGVDLREYGFGDFNLWHYPHDDLDAIYEAQVGRGDLSDPWLFLSTPGLHSDAPGIAPPGGQVLVAATACSHAHFRAARDAGPEAYLAEKGRVRERMLDVIEARYLPGLRRHIAVRVAGSPTTNERFCRAPQGNAYGVALRPEHALRLPFETPIPNLHLVNATAGFPSVAGTIASGRRCFAHLLAEGPSWRQG